MTERHCTKCEAYEILIDKLAQKSEERNKDLKTRIKDLEQKLAAQDKVVKTVPILTECCRNLQWQLKDKDKVIQKVIYIYMVIFSDFFVALLSVFLIHEISLLSFLHSSRRKRKLKNSLKWHQFLEDFLRKKRHSTIFHQI